MPFFPVHQNKFITPIDTPKALGWSHKEMATSRQNPKVTPSSPPCIDALSNPLPLSATERDADSYELAMGEPGVGVGVGKRIMGGIWKPPRASPLLMASKKIGASVPLSQGLANNKRELGRRFFPS